MHYVKVAFFAGSSLHPVPPGKETKDAHWVNIREDDLDETQTAERIRKAATARLKRVYGGGSRSLRAR